MRLFVGIDLPEHIKLELLKLQSDLRSAGVSAAWKSKENFHITLAFLGEVAPAGLEWLKAALSRAVVGQEPFELSIAGMGCFPNWERPNVLWAGLNGQSSRLFSLQAQVIRELKAAGMKTEERAFKPHITLAARPMGAARGQRAQTEGFLVTGISLIESSVINNRRTYVSLADFSLSTIKK